MFKGETYDELLSWKSRSMGSTALLVEGARRVGKSMVVEEFAKAEYVLHAKALKVEGGRVFLPLYMSICL